MCVTRNLLHKTMIGNFQDIINITTLFLYVVNLYIGT